VLDNGSNHHPGVIIGLSAGVVQRQNISFPS
jgi:hypothetical protein